MIQWCHNGALGSLRTIRSGRIHACLESALDVRDESTQSISLNSQLFIASVVNGLIAIVLATFISILTIQPGMAESVTIASLKMCMHLNSIPNILVYLTDHNLLKTESVHVKFKKLSQC